MTGLVGWLHGSLLGWFQIEKHINQTIDEQQHHQPSHVHNERDVMLVLGQYGHSIFHEFEKVIRSDSRVMDHPTRTGHRKMNPKLKDTADEFARQARYPPGSIEQSQSD